MGRLDGKVALISGGSKGQGAAEAKLFAQEGAKVVLADILDDEGKKVEAEINETGGEAMYLHLDVTSEADWAAAVRAAVDSYGKLDILVNNAGILLRKGVEETSAE
ncbi:MAG: cyclopentanol dehydrogenase, partial [Candidatus Poseidoniales archaeon]